MLIKAVIFDFDGVLVDSTSTGMRIIREVACDMGLTIPSYDMLRAHWGPPLSELWDSLAVLLDWPVERKEEFIKQFMTLDLEITYFPNPNLIRVLNQFNLVHNLVMAIATNRSKESFEMAWYKLQIDKKLFCHIQTRVDGRFKKPDPAMLDSIFKKLGVLGIAPQECVYVGDTLAADWELTLRCDPPLTFFGVVSGAVLESDLCKSIGGEYVIKSVIDLPGRLKRLRLI